MSRKSNSISGRQTHVLIDYEADYVAEAFAEADSNRAHFAVVGLTSHVEGELGLFED